VCQILFEGHYQGILKPMVHYLPLKKDFSNFDNVIRMFRDPVIRNELTENAYRDLIASGRYSYQKFIQAFDSHLEAAGQRPVISAEAHRRIWARLGRGKVWRTLRARTIAACYQNLVLKAFITRLARPLIARYRHAMNPLGVS
jgi:hypothetical protein